MAAEATGPRRLRFRAESLRLGPRSAMSPSAGGRNRARFATTRWSLVLALGQPADEQRRAALSTLCELYWFPLYAFIRRSGRSPDAAQDLTQAFFATLLEKDYFQQARRERGRLRTFLLTALRHFMANEHDAATAQRRGGGQIPLSLEFDDGERRYAREPTDPLTPEAVYERQWAEAVLAEAAARLEAKHRAGWMRGSRFFEPLREYVLEDVGGSYQDLAAQLETTEASLRVTLHRMRQAYLLCLREAIADTVEGAGAVEAELRHVLAAASARV
jgi:DNA-directed RNA polymerase specialized sigma24 family protein